MLKGFNITTEKTLKGMLQVIYSNFARRKDVLQLKQHVKDEVTTELSDFNKKLADNLINENQKTVTKVEELEASTKEKADFASAKTREISDYAKRVQENFTRAQELQQLTAELQASAVATEEETQKVVAEFTRIRDSLSTAVLYKGTVDNYEDLPTAAKIGWMYNVKSAKKEQEINAGDNLVWNGEAWDNMGGFIDPDDILNGAHDAVFNNVKAEKVTAETFEGTATNAVKLIDPTGQNAPLINDQGTENNEDTWIPVFNNDKIQHTEKLKMTVGAAKELSGSIFTKDDDNEDTVWFKVAQCQSPAAYYDMNIMFLVRDTKANDRGGILVVRARANSENIVESCNFFWLVKHGCDDSEFVMLNNTEAPYKLEIWTKLPTRYQSRQFIILNKSARIYNETPTWTLNESFIGAGETAYTTGMQAQNPGIGGEVTLAHNIYNQTPRLANATENNEIAIHDYPGGTFKDLIPGAELQAIRKAIDFDWYDSRWSIGNMRSGDRYSDGFAFGYKKDKNAGYDMVSWIATDGTYSGPINVHIPDGQSRALVQASMGGSDYAAIVAGGRDDGSWLEIATADNGNEAIYVKQYNFVEGNSFGECVRSASLLDNDGDTRFPQTVHAPWFDGAYNIPSHSCAWIDARDNAPLRQKVWDEYSPFSSIRTQNGTWDNGAYRDNILYWSYITDNDYNARNNQQSAWMKFHPNGLIESSSGFLGMLHTYDVKTNAEGSRLGYFGLNIRPMYGNVGFPTSFGNVLSVGGQGDGQLLLGWSGETNGIEHVFYRNRRDCVDTWSEWRALAFTTDTVANSDTVDGCHENNFLRYRDAVGGGTDTLWSQIGIRQYNNGWPAGVGDGYTYGAVVSLPAVDARLDIWYNHICSENGDGLAYRSGWGEDRKRWVRILDTGNFTRWAVSRDNDTIGTLYVNDWFRCNNNCGIYWQSWGGGWYMEDSTWIRAYNGKNIYTSGSIMCDGEARFNSTILCRGQVVHSDYAEYFQKEKETKIDVGDIVALDTNAKGKERYVKATEDSKVLVGVHSDEYAMAIGGNAALDEDEEVPISLVGRVWVNITGNPQIGDKITASKIPGVGRVAKEGERSVGIVLTEPKDGKVRILVDLKQ